MVNSDKSFIDNIIIHTRSSEKKFKEGNFKGAIEDKREVRSLLNSKSCDENIIKKFKEELSNLYASRFDLINDHKLRIDELKINVCGKSLLYLLGTNVDWKEDYMGNRFVFENPNASSKCGCGTTFSI